MSPREIVYIIDVESGNLRSLQNAVERLGFEARFIKQGSDSSLLSASKLILPGVGNFGHFVRELRARGFVKPINQYISSGKPIMGICVGLQAFFKGSEESPDTEGLDYIDLQLGRFDDSDKAVPQIGWNCLKIRGFTENGKTLYNMSPDSRYYFVHSYAAIVTDKVIDDLEGKGWDLAIAKYGDQRFIASVIRDNVFATQFHPEKSGPAGLKVIKAFLQQEKVTKLATRTSLTTLSTPAGLSRRVIACLDVRTNDQGDLVVTKGDQYDVREKKEEGGDVRNLGKPVQLAEKYYKQGADEVTFLNITSFRNSPIKDQPMLEVLRQAAKTCFVPLTVGGGIKSVVDPDGTTISALDVATLYFKAGADKVSIGSDAVKAAEELIENGGKPTGKTPIETISKAYGNQAVVISVDPKRYYVKDPKSCKYRLIHTSIPGPNGEEYCYYRVTSQGGRKVHELGAWELCQACEKLGAGEVLLNCIDKDGTNSGYDFELINQVKSSVRIPVIASSGAGKPQHFVDVFRNTAADAALGAGMFHRGEYTVDEVKRYMREQGLSVRIDYDDVEGGK
ncbi:DEKNAAC103820 [Brettanomyces naardenensis]|uniref:Imidazole glycerol phosphate synthase hisHF n=1 Tax=Brettanomyces naardenensis TaxID=13370 RepID=A0A448YP93_BRENA|nr:DEKNAAC103820 [Brettanomyces naardenensis]